MVEIGSKSGLGVVLSSIQGFGENSLQLEQYITPGEIASEILWGAYMRDHISGKVILDAGCGTGIFGLGALLLGASKVYFVDVDHKVLDISQKNFWKLDKKYDLGDALFIQDNIEKFDQKVDCVLQNPPFGTKEKHADKIFLEKAFQLSLTVYTLHKLSTSGFVRAIAEDNNFEAKILHKINFPIKAVHDFHRKKEYDVEVGVWLLEK